MNKSLENIAEVGAQFGAHASNNHGVEVEMRFPKAALVEFSSNSTNITIQHEDGNLQSITHKPGLGALDERGDLNSDIVEKTLGFLDKHKSTLAEIPSDNIRAFGTGSLRDAKNSDVFQERLNDQFGLDVYVLSGEEEAHNSAIGIKSFFGDEAQGVVWDFGGRSSEFAIIDENGEISNEVSLQLGSLVLAEIEEGPQRLDYIRSELGKLPLAYTQQSFENMYVTGGNPRRVVAQVVGEADYKNAHGRSASALDTKVHIDSLLEGDSYMDKVEDKHFQSLFPKAGLVFQELLQELDVKDLVASNSATRAGAVFLLNEDIHNRQNNIDVAATADCE